MPEETPQGFLESLDIATPCRANWDDMTGDDRTRFCNDCQKNVYNISEMSRKEAERLIQSNQAGICVRMFRRADGTVINEDCPVGLRSLKRSVRLARQRLWQTAAACVAVVSAMLGGAAKAEDAKSEKKDTQKQGDKKKEVKAPAPLEPTMGAVCPTLTDAQLKTEKSVQEQVSKSILAAYPQISKLTKGSVQLYLKNEGTVDNARIAVSTGDKQLDEKIKASVLKTELKDVNDFPSWWAIVINFNEIGKDSAAAK